MIQDKVKRYEKFKSFITYLDILTYALALSDQEEFDAEPNKWHEAVYQICQSYREQIPELKRIYFSFREPLPPQSEQVDRLIKVISMSGEIASPNPRWPTIDMDKAKKEKIREREEKRQEQYKPQVDKIRQIFEEKLKPISITSQ